MIKAWIVKLRIHRSKKVEQGVLFLLIDPAALILHDKNKLFHSLIIMYVHEYFTIDAAVITIKYNIENNLFESFWIADCLDWNVPFVHNIL